MRALSVPADPCHGRCPCDADDFGRYVREVKGQLVCDLIDINIVSWLIFGLFPLIGWAITKPLEAERLAEFSEGDVEEKYRQLTPGGPPPNPDAVKLLLGTNWIWFGLSLGLAVVVFNAHSQVSAEGGTACHR